VSNRIEAASFTEVDTSETMTTEIPMLASAQEAQTPTPRNAHDVAGCAPAREVMSRVGDKWSMLVVMLLGDGPLRFNELMRAAGDVSQRMLSLTLKKLERDGLVLRTETPTVPPRVDYELTDLGLSLRMPVKALGQWAIVNHTCIEMARIAFDQRTARRQQATLEKPLPVRSTGGDPTH
jgi:DNA-binding HxlR family transcriptional regulator